MANCLDLASQRYTVLLAGMASPLQIARSGSPQATRAQILLTVLLVQVVGRPGRRLAAGIALF
jgi:hypothetical protein